MQLEEFPIYCYKWQLWYKSEWGMYPVTIIFGTLAPNEIDLRRNMKCLPGVNSPPRLFASLPPQPQATSCFEEFDLASLSLSPPSLSPPLSLLPLSLSPCSCYFDDDCHGRKVRQSEITCLPRGSINFISWIKGSKFFPGGSLGIFGLSF